LQTRQAPYEELFDLLRSKSEKESLEVFRRIRNGGDVESILRHVKDGDLLMQMLVVPESHRQYQFPYVPEMPDYILSPDNPYLDSLIFDATTLGHTLPIGAALQRESRSVPYQCPYLKPYRAAEIVDGTLSQIDVSRWTRVLNENRLLRRLLHDFFLYQHPWSAFFHKDHVLEDMALGQSLFCSQLLVNSILAVACVSHMILHLFPIADNFLEAYILRNSESSPLLGSRKSWLQISRRSQTTMGN
jgi:hypothetical protein